MSEIRTIIVDDEAKACTNLELLLTRYCPNIRVQGKAHAVKPAIKLIKEVKPDLVFLDIELQRGTGFDVLDAFPVFDFQVVFATAYQEYALKAIKVGALDYILKPIHPEELQKVVKRMEEQMTAKSTQPSSQEKISAGKLILPSMGGFHIINVPEVLYCMADGNYVHFKCRDGRHFLVTRHMKVYEELLEDQGFFRIHHSYLVNLDAVRQFITKDGYTIVLENGESLPVATRKKDEFVRKMKLI